MEKQEGDTVNEGDILLEIMSDKTNMELEAEDSGVLLKITRQAGETVPVTEVIGYIGAEGESVEVSSPAASDVNVARTTEDLEAAGLEVPKAPAQAASAAPKLHLLMMSMTSSLLVVALQVIMQLFVVLNLVVKLPSLRNLNLVELA